MGSDRTFVTEVATGLGMLGDDIGQVLARRPSELQNLRAADWDRLTGLWHAGAYRAEFIESFGNGRAFFAAEDALRGRRPRIVEWTGERRPPGDEVVPSDLRIDHVYLISCKYLSKILHNPSPARLVDGLLSQQPVDDARDWYQRVAPLELQDLYSTCRSALGGIGVLPEVVEDLTPSDRRGLAQQLREGWPEASSKAYARLCRAVADRTAELWRKSIGDRGGEQMLWRILRIGSAPYFILGAAKNGSMRLRIDTPWDWRQAFRLLRFEVTAQPGGQPRVSWSAWCEERAAHTTRTVTGHVEIRWSHGRFAQPPEAKVYLDTPHQNVPGYHGLAPLSPMTVPNEPSTLFRIERFS